MSMADARNVQRRLLQWFTSYRRDLPWRRTNDPYRILVSEIMLQQTQVSRVAPKYEAFLKRFPSLRILAHAQQRSVVSAWAGLGYNRRARNLHQLARAVLRDHQGRLPKTMHGLRQLPGVGEYTAAAVACFAYGAPVALVDVNVRRVLGRIFYGVRGPAKLSNDRVWKLAASLVPAKRPVAWNSMLMDFGATVCTQRTPRCERCPLRGSCSAYPAILEADGRTKQAPAPFVGSTRYWRGRVVSFLRAQPRARTSRAKVQRVFRAQGLEGEQFNAILAALVHDNLVHRRGRELGL